MIDFLTKIEEKQKRVNETLEDIKILRDIKNANFPYIFPYEDLEIDYFWFEQYFKNISFSFTFKNKKLSLDEKENFAIFFIDGLDGCPQPHVYGGSEKPIYCISTHVKVTLQGYKVGISFILGNEIPEVYEVKINEKIRIEKVCEVSCKKKEK